MWTSECRVKQSHVWGWLDPSSNTDLMPVTYLKGAGAAIGRGIEAFEAKQCQQGTETAPAGGSPFQAGRWVPSHHNLILPVPRPFRNAAA